MAKVILDWKTATSFITDAFEKVGVPRDEAKICTDILLEADRRGIESHGCNRFKPIYLDRIKIGIQNPKTNFEIIKETETTAVVDGHDGMGQVIGYKAMKMAIEKAKKHGLGMVVVRNSCHYGIAGYYGTMASRAGCISINGTNARPSVAPTFGVDGMFGTNPITIGIPTDEPFDFLIDCATSITQNGKLEYYDRIGELIHPGTVINEDGTEYEGDAGEALKKIRKGTAALTPVGGIGEELGGYKGYGYGVAVEILSAALQDGQYLKALSGVNEKGEKVPYHLGHYFIAIDTDHFLGEEKCRKISGDILRKIRASKKQPGHDRIFTAGEKEYLIWQQRKDTGVPINPSVQKELSQIRDELKLDYVFPWEDSGIIIHSGRVATLGCEKVDYIENGYVRISKEGLITEIGQEPHPLKDKNEREYDAEGKLILPGFVCGHGHFYGLYSRGLDTIDKPASGFLEVLERLWWRLDRALDNADSNYYSALIYTLEGLRAGTTCIIDHHASPNYIMGSLDDLERATKDVGIRSCLCYEVTDRNGMEGAELGIKENIRYMRKIAENKDDMVGACFGLHAPFTLSDKTLYKCKEEIEKFRKDYPKFNAGFHVHVAEGKYDEDFSYEKYGMSCIERLQKIGSILGENTIVGHGVFLNDKELDILAQTKTNIMTNPESNMNNAVGVPDIKKMISKNIMVGLGTDGMTYDMLQEYRTSCLLHKLTPRDPREGTIDTFNMLFRNNSIIASKFFNHPVGRLEKGAFGDVIIIDYKNPTVLGSGNLPWQLHFGISTAGVKKVFVGGKEIYRNGKSTRIDEENAYKTSREVVTPHVWEKFKEIVHKEIK